MIFDRPGPRQVIVRRIDLDDPFRGPYLRRNLDFVSAVDPLTDCLDGDDDPVHISFVGGCQPIRAAKSILENVPFASEFTLASTEYESRDFAFLDVLRRGVTKGATLAEWAALRGIAREDVMAIGDNFNDREMLEFAGLPVVMGNAIPELKALGGLLRSVMSRTASPKRFGFTLLEVMPSARRPRQQQNEASNFLRARNMARHKLALQKIAPPKIMDSQAIETAQLTTRSAGAARTAANHGPAPANRGHRHGETPAFWCKAHAQLLQLFSPFLAFWRRAGNSCASRLCGAAIGRPAAHHWL